MSVKKSSWKTPFFTMKFIAILLIGIMLIGIYLKTEDSQNPSNSGPQLNKPRLTAFEDRTIDLTHLSLPQSEYILFNFWATWCPTCKPELKQLNSLMDQWLKQNIEIISVNVDDKKNEVEVNKLWTGLNLKLKTILDQNKKYSSLFPLEVLPSYFLVKDNQKLLLRIDGATDWSKKENQDLILNTLTHKKEGY